MPCREAKPEEITAFYPQYLGKGSGPVPNRYICPRCGKMYVTFRACALHMGIVSNVAGTCFGGR